MLLGIDVGGTFTDAVLLKGDQVLAQAKVPTTHKNVLEGILAALDRVLEPRILASGKVFSDTVDKNGKSEQDIQTAAQYTGSTENEAGKGEQIGTAQEIEGIEKIERIERIVISSTIVTNALTEGKLEPALLAVIQGPGRNTQGLFPVEPIYIQGCVDHRGQITATPKWQDYPQLKQARGVCAASCKFAVREPQLENMLAHKLQQNGAEQVFCGSQLSGQLNFIRRTNSAYFAAVVYKLFCSFCQRVQQALQQRNLQAPVHILKADGGTLPLEAALQQPVEAVFTGPAASVLGIEALSAPEVNSISLDVGGTTTDIAFWQEGRALTSHRGASIDGYPTAVRSYYMRSVGIGGDSAVRRREDGSLTVGPDRIGPAAAVGGTGPTLSDALICAGYISFGNVSAAMNSLIPLLDSLYNSQANDYIPATQNALKEFVEPQESAEQQIYAATQESAESTESAQTQAVGTPQAIPVAIKALAEEIVQVAVKSLQSTIEEMLQEWATQPVYTVDDVIRGTEFIPQQLIGVGGGAPGLIRALGATMDLPVVIPQGAMVANAIGAAVARPTLSAGLRADTSEGYYLIPEAGERRPITSRFNAEVAQQYLSQWLLDATQEWGMASREVELLDLEHFRTVHSYYDTGDIYNLRMQLKPGILHKVQGREVEFK